MGVSRQHFYDIKKAYEDGGLDALKDESRRKPNRKNRVPEEIEKAVLEVALEQPAYGQVRASNELRKKGVTISPAGVRCVWLRHGLETRKTRFRALEEKVAQDGLILTKAQVAALEQARKDRENDPDHIDTEHPGYLVAQDTMYIGYLKGVGRIYQQTVIDTYSSVGFAKVYTRKTPITAADSLNDRVVPFFEDHGVKIHRILTDRGTEYCGRADSHHYQLFLGLNDIEHTRTKAKSPQTNGICERFNQTCLNEFYKVAFRKKIFDSLEELQRDLDKFIEDYNEVRTHQGKRCQGRTPLQTFLDSLPLTREKQIEPPPSSASTRMGPALSSSESKPKAVVADPGTTEDLEGRIAG
jgi:transposase InsO family protein